MTQPLAFDTIIGEFDQNDEAWVLKDRDTGKNKRETYSFAQ